MYTSRTCTCEIYYHILSHSKHAKLWHQKTAWFEGIVTTAVAHISGCEHEYQLWDGRNFPAIPNV